VLHQAIGWLAREDKVRFDAANGSEKICLK
jgi:hypothetical protein